MKKIVKFIATILLFFIAVPLLAGFVIMMLWNNILTSACAFSALSIWQGIGIFILGQILSGGFVLGCFLAMGSLHHIVGHRREPMGRHWHNMTDEERCAFIERRMKSGFRHHHHDEGDGAE